MNSEKHKRTVYPMHPQMAPEILSPLKEKFFFLLMMDAITNLPF